MRLRPLVTAPLLLTSAAVTRAVVIYDVLFTGGYPRSQPANGRRANIFSTRLRCERRHLLYPGFALVPLRH